MFPPSCASPHGADMHPPPAGLPRRDRNLILAHLRFFGWAGIAQKPHDFLAVFACQHCHDIVDRRAGGVGTSRTSSAPLETLMRHHAAGRMTFNPT